MHKEEQISRNRAIVACKRVAAHIGLKAADVLLLDTLIAFSQPQDWEVGARPIVWPSNAYLMEQTGFSLSTLKRHVRRLADTGVMTFRDSPNGKRWGHRTHNGAIAEAYGFDLTPLAARTVEFEMLAEQLNEERERCQQMKRQITIARRSIRAILEAIQMEGQWDESWEGVNGQYRALLERLPKGRVGPDTLIEVLTLFEALQSKIDHVHHIEATDEIPLIEPNMDTMGAISEPHIQTTNQLQDSESKETEAESDNQNTPKLSLRTILDACPEFKEWLAHLGRVVRTWDDFFDSASRLYPMMGISNNTWNRALNLMGHTMTATAFALVFEKAQAGQVGSPNGYLIGMARKAQEGRLYLERSFYGLLARQETLPPIRA